MSTRRATFVLPVAAAAYDLILAGDVRSAMAQEAPPATSSPDPLRLYDVAFDTYIFGYPAIYMGLTRKVRTAVPAFDPASGRAPVNQMGHNLTLLDASFTDVVRANVDTLYDSAFLDLRQEPMVLS